MKVLLFRSVNLIASRCNKYVNFYRREGINFTAVGWDRKGSGIQKENYDFFRYKAESKIGGIKAMRNHLHWMWFVYQYIKRHPDVTTVHACDLNCAFPAAIYKMFHNKKLNIIFDSCDWFSANLAQGNITRDIYQWMERFAYGKSDKLIICEPEREEQIQFKLKEKPLVLPNIPEIDVHLLENADNRYKFPNDWPTIVYFGTFIKDRFLVEMLSLTKTEKFNLLIGGYGDQEIENLCEKLDMQDNVRYFGRMEMRDGLQMEKSADIIYAMYCKSNPNHKYAAPNKYYEALLLGKPIISTKGIILEKKILDNKIGYAIEENGEELRKLLASLDRKEMISLGNNAHRLWEAKFKNYLPKFFDLEYKKILK